MLYILVQKRAALRCNRQRMEGAVIITVIGYIYLRAESQDHDQQTLLKVYQSVGLSILYEDQLNGACAIMGMEQNCASR